MALGQQPEREESWLDFDYDVLRLPLEANIKLESIIDLALSTASHQSGLILLRDAILNSTISNTALLGTFLSFPSQVQSLIEEKSPSADWDRVFGLCSCCNDFFPSDENYSEFRGFLLEFAVENCRTRPNEAGLLVFSIFDSISQLKRKESTRKLLTDFLCRVSVECASVYSIVVNRLLDRKDLCDWLSVDDRLLHRLLQAFLPEGDFCLAIAKLIRLLKVRAQEALHCLKVEDRARLIPALVQVFGGDFRCLLSWSFDLLSGCFDVSGVKALSKFYSDNSSFFVAAISSSRHACEILLSLLEVGDELICKTSIETISDSLSLGVWSSEHSSLLAGLINRVGVGQLKEVLSIFLRSDKILVKDKFGVCVAAIKGGFEIEEDFFGDLLWCIARYSSRFSISIDLLSNCSKELFILFGDCAGFLTPACNQLAKSFIVEFLGLLSAKKYFPSWNFLFQEGVFPWIERVGDQSLVLQCLCIAVQHSTLNEPIAVTILRKFVESKKMDSQISHPIAQNYLFALAGASFCFEIVVLAYRLLKRAISRLPSVLLPSMWLSLGKILRGYDVIPKTAAERFSFLLKMHIYLLDRFLEPQLGRLVSILLSFQGAESDYTCCNFLRSIILLARCFKEEILKIAPTIIDSIFQIIRTCNQVRKLVAIRCLYEVALYSSCSSQLWKRNPDLISFIRMALSQGQCNIFVAREYVRLLGLIGAIDPQKLSTFAISAAGDQPSSSDSSFAILPTGSYHQQGDADFFASFVIGCLQKLLEKQQTEPSLKIDILEMILRVFSHSTNKLYSRFGLFGNYFMNSALDYLHGSCVLVINFVLVGRGYAIPYAKQIVDYMKQFPLKEGSRSPTHIWRFQWFTLLVAFKRCLSIEFLQYSHSLADTFLFVLESAMSEAPLDIAVSVLSALPIVVCDFSLFLPQILSTLLCSRDNPLVMASGLEIVKEIIAVVPNAIREHALEISKKVHSILESCSVEILSAKACELLGLFDFGSIVKRLDHLSIPLVPKFSIVFSYANDPTPQCDTDEEASRQATIFSQAGWQEWLQEFSLDLLIKSPSIALRLAAGVASRLPPLSKELFNAAFLACWRDSKDRCQGQFMQVLSQILAGRLSSVELVQRILNLAEFIEHDEQELFVDFKTLAALAQKCRSYSKALRYYELAYQHQPSTAIIDALADVCSQLQLEDASVGILEHGERVHGTKLRQGWDVNVQRPESLMKFAEAEVKTVLDEEAIYGLLKCKYALEDWQEIHSIANERWPDFSSSLKILTAPIVATSSWMLCKWSDIDHYAKFISPDSTEKGFFKVIAKIHKGDWNVALKCIDSARDSLIVESLSSFHESDSRTYECTLRMQLLAELEEGVRYQQDPDIRTQIQTLWNERIDLVLQSPDVVGKILRFRSLFPVGFNLPHWLRYLKICRKQDQVQLGQGVLCQILQQRSLLYDFAKNPKSASKEPPELVLATFRYYWHTEQNQLIAISKLAEYVDQIKQDGGASALLVAKSMRLYGKWLRRFNDSGVTRENFDSVVKSFGAAILYDPKNIHSWHLWAQSAFEAASLLESRASLTEKAQIPKLLSIAVKGLIQSISLGWLLSPKTILQDTLRFITILFKHASNQELHTLIATGIQNLPTEIWLDVIPQIIARIHAPNPHVRRLVHQILLSLSKIHPQTLLFSLTIASTSSNATRKAAALLLIDRIRADHPQLVDQVLLITNELIRVSVSWGEIWLEGLEEASKRFFGDKNVSGMFSVLNFLHSTLERGPETHLEHSFYRLYQKQLKEARDWCTQYQKTLNIVDLNQAWDLYYVVFRDLSKSLSGLSTVDLGQASPKLFQLRNLEVSVPGEPSTCICQFGYNLSVISSKQRPRKLEIVGDNGKSYWFLLKGHEDLRQDQRIMQFLELINTLLSSTRETADRRLAINTYRVIPLSSNSGLISWLTDHDTLHSLIKVYRENHSIPQNQEHRAMLQCAPTYDNLPSLQKIEIFEHALSQTSGSDLAKIFWLKSKSSEHWLECRTRYTRTLATMSIVGYVLGLGDRHPSNLMIDPNTGTVTHIDFGDCFETAMYRDRYPESVPFRLTRMLVKAMEVSGVSGTFKVTCRLVAKVLRANKDCLLALLEAFVYDPLVVNRIAKNDFTSGDALQSAADRSFFIAADSDVDLSSTYTNSRALQTIRRVFKKLAGRDFQPDPMSVHDQVDQLIKEATSVENLSKCYVGWCPFW